MVIYACIRHIGEGANVFIYHEMHVCASKMNFGKLKLTFVTFFPMIYARKTLPNDLCLVEDHLRLKKTTAKKENNKRYI